MQLVSVNFDIARRFYRGGFGFAIRIAIFVQGEHTLGPGCCRQVDYSCCADRKRHRVSLETYTAIGALIPGNGSPSYPTSSKSSNSKSPRFLTAGFSFICGNVRMSQLSCRRA